MPKTKLGDFSISYMQVLDENGVVDTDLEPSLSKEQLVELYRHMPWGRITDERMLKLQRQGRIGTFGPSIGQEAAHCASMFCMRDDDWFVGCFREHGARLMRGESLVKQLNYFNGYTEGNIGGNPRNLPISVIVGAQSLHAVGLAYASKLKGEDSVAIVYQGDGATSQGDFHEALNFASVWNVPVIFLVQNNQWAISVPREKQTKSKSIAQKAIAYEMHGIQVDGNDPLAVYAATAEAAERARNGEGPTLIEAVTYRMMMHTTADDQYKYRTKEEEDSWKPKDPLIRFKKYMEDKGFWDNKAEEKLQAELKADCDAQVKEFESQPDFPRDVSFEHVFGTEHAVISEQKVEFDQELEEENDA